MSTPVPSGAPAGALEDLSVRMARVETDVSWIKREMVTKADLADVRGEMARLRGELKADIANLRAELSGEFKTDIGTVRGEIGTLRGEMHAMETRLIKWMVGTALTCAGVAAAAATAAARLIA